MAARICLPLLGVLFVVACTKGVPATTTPACAVPEPPRALAMKVTRSTLPMGAPATSETGTIAEPGGCAGEALCRELPRDALLGVLARVRPALRARNEPAAGSPHYGGRFIEIHFEGGRCDVSDSSQGAIVAADRPLFDEAFDAITGAYAPSEAGAR